MFPHLPAVIKKTWEKLPCGLTKSRANIQYNSYNTRFSVQKCRQCKNIVRPHGNQPYTPWQRMHGDKRSAKGFLIERL